MPQQEICGYCNQTIPLPENDRFYNQHHKNWCIHRLDPKRCRFCDGVLPYHKDHCPEFKVNPYEERAYRDIRQ